LIRTQRQTDINTYIQYLQRDRKTDRKPNRQTDRQTDTQTDRDTQ
jgi:hypothetical protein